VLAANADPRRVIASVALLGALVAGCGGGPLTRDELLSKANAICDRAQNESAGVREPSPSGGPEDTARYVSALVPIARREFRDLHALTPPSALSKGYGEYLAAGDRGVRLLEQLRAAAGARHAGQGRALLMRLETLTNDADERAKKLGLSGCAE
jgi:hypothetical protein